MAERKSSKRSDEKLFERVIRSYARFVESKEFGYFNYLPAKVLRKVAPFLLDKCLDEQGGNSPSLRDIIDSLCWIKGVEATYPVASEISLQIDGVYVKKERLIDLIRKWMGKGLSFPSECVYDLRYRAFWLSWSNFGLSQPVHALTDEQWLVFRKATALAPLISESFDTDAVVLYNFTQDDEVSVCVNLVSESSRMFLTLLVDVGKGEELNVSLFSEASRIFSKKLREKDGARRSTWRKMKEALSFYFI